MDVKNFKNIDGRYRPAPFWSWNLTLEPAEVNRQLKNFKDRGAGGVFICPDEALSVAHLGEAFMEAVRQCARAGRRLGLDIWLCENPEAAAGGELAGVRDYRMRALLFTGGGQAEDEILERRGEKALLIRAMNPEGAPCRCDFFSSETTDAFLSAVHDKYRRACARFLGYEIAGFFDGVRRKTADSFGDGGILFAKSIAEAFSKKSGRDISEVAISLFFQEGDYRKTRLDYYKTAAELFSEAYAKRYQKWCGKNGLKYISLPAAPDLLSQVRRAQNAMGLCEHADYPAALISPDPSEGLLSVKQAASVGEQLGKEQIFGAAGGCLGRHAPFADRLRLLNISAAAGVTFFNSSLAPYSLQGKRKRGAAGQLFYPDALAAHEKDFSESAARLCELMGKSKRVVNVLVLSPMPSVVCEYSPADEKDARFYADAFSRLCQKLWELKIDFHIGDEALIQKYGSATPERLKVGAYSYSTVIFPPLVTLSAPTLGLFELFKGAVFAAAPFPALTDARESLYSLPDSAVLCESADEAAEKAAARYPDRAAVLDAQSGENAADICAVHKTSGKDDLYFFASAHLEGEREAVLRINEKRNGYVLDAAAGEIYSAPFENGEMRAVFAKGGSLALLFTDREIKAEGAQIIRSGVRFSDFAPIGKITPKRVEREENILRVSGASALFGDEGGWEALSCSLLGERLDQLPDGAAFRVKYVFEAEEKPEDRLFLIVESALGLDEITVNQNAVAPDGAWRVDPAFDKIDITDHLVLGVNTVEISGKKMPARAVSETGRALFCEAEAIYISGNFSILDGKIRAPRALTLGDVTAQGLPFYAGGLTYRLVLPDIGLKKRRIKLDGAFEGAKVRVKKREISLINAPFEIELYDYERGCEAEIVISNTFYNLLERTDEEPPTPFGLNRIWVG